MPLTVTSRRFSVLLRGPAHLVQAVQEFKARGQQRPAGERVAKGAQHRSNRWLAAGQLGACSWRL